MTITPMAKCVIKVTTKYADQFTYVVFYMFI